MSPKLSLILLGTILALSSYVESKSFNECPNENLADVLIGSVFCEVPAKEHTSLVRRYRLPEEGLYDDFITCLLVTDMSHDDGGGYVEITDGGVNHRFAEVSDVSIDDGGGDVEITAGGVGHRYVEVRLNSNLGKELDYIIMAYTSRSSTPSITYI